MSKFNVGDRVLVNRSLVAEIHTYDEDSDRLVYEHAAGGGKNTVYAHVSNTDLKLIEAAGTGDEAFAGAVQPEPPFDEPTVVEADNQIADYEADEITTAGSL